MTKIKEINKERIISVLKKAVDIYEQFLEIAQRDILDPLSKSDAETCNKNLEKFGTKTTVAEILKLVVRGAVLLAPVMIKLFSEIDDEKKYMDDAAISERVNIYQDRLKKIMAKSI